MNTFGYIISKDFSLLNMNQRFFKIMTSKNLNFSNFNII